LKFLQNTQNLLFFYKASQNQERLLILTMIIKDHEDRKNTYYTWGGVTSKKQPWLELKPCLLQQLIICMSMCLDEKSLEHPDHC